MFENFDWRLVVAITATVLTIIGYIPYFKDVFAKRTKPHIYTWMIWAITQGTATVALLYGGGKFGSMSLVIGTVLVLFIFGLSFKYGTKNITKVDTITLIVALSAIVVWWKLNNPLLAVIMISMIDGLAYIPTIRKSYAEPYSETISFWIIMAIVSTLTIVSNAEYNLLTVTYLSVLAVANVATALVISIRRRAVQNPSTPAHS